jgi:hypothetical protein
MSNSMLLPPKMCAQYAERARNNDFEFHLSPDIYVWFNGNQKVVVIGLDKPKGHIVQLTASLVEIEKKSLAASTRRQKERPKAV